MEYVTVSLIVGEGLKTVQMPKEMISDLAVKLREEGKYAVHTLEESYEVEGFVVLAKGTKNGVMLISNLKEDTKEENPFGVRYES